jgi:hypothetical protein
VGVPPDVSLGRRWAVGGGLGAGGAGRGTGDEAGRGNGGIVHSLFQQYDHGLLFTDRATTDDIFSDILQVCR